MKYIISGSHWMAEVDHTPRVSVGYTAAAPLLSIDAAGSSLHIANTSCLLTILRMTPTVDHYHYRGMLQSTFDRDNLVRRCGYNVDNGHSREEFGAQTRQTVMEDTLPRPWPTRHLSIHRVRSAGAGTNLARPGNLPGGSHNDRVRSARELLSLANRCVRYHATRRIPGQSGRSV